MKKNKTIDLITVLFILLIPLSWAEFVVGSVYRNITIILLCIFLLLIKGKYKVQRDNADALILWTILVVYIAISVVWSKNFSLAFSYVLGMTLVYAIVLIFAYCTSNIANFYDYAWVLVGIVCVALFLFGDRADVGEYGSRDTLLILGTSTDPNEFAGTLLVPISLNVYFAINSRKLYVKIINVIVMLLQLYAVLLTGSRGALLSAAIAMVITFLMTYKFSLVSFSSTLCIISVMLVIVTVYIIPSIPIDIIERLSIDGVVADGGGGRWTLWMDALHQFSEGSIFRMLFGYGQGGMMIVGERGDTGTAHNQIIQFLINFGIIGFTLYISLLLKTFSMIIKRNPRYVGAFLGMMALSLTITTPPSYKPLWILVAMAFTKADEKQTERIKRKVDYKEKES